MRTAKVALGRAKKPLSESEKLVKALDKGNKAKSEKDLEQGTSLKVENIYLPLNHLFNQAAKRAFERHVDQEFTERKVSYVTSLEREVIDEVRYFGSVAVGERKIFDAAQKVANQINFYCDKGFVTGQLCKLIMVQLATEPHQLERWAIVSYVALSPEGIAFLKSNPTKIEFEVGSVPFTSDDS